MQLSANAAAAPCADRLKYVPSRYNYAVIFADLIARLMLHLLFCVKLLNLITYNLRLFDNYVFSLPSQFARSFGASYGVFLPS
jgi:hypothetical protein